MRSSSLLIGALLATSGVIGAAAGNDALKGNQEGIRRFSAPDDNNNTDYFTGSFPCGPSGGGGLIEDACENWDSPSLTWDDGFDDLEEHGATPSEDVGGYDQVSWSSPEYGVWVRKNGTKTRSHWEDAILAPTMNQRKHQIDSMYAERRVIGYVALAAVGTSVLTGVAVCGYRLFNHCREKLSAATSRTVNAAGADETLIPSTSPRVQV